MKLKLITLKARTAGFLAAIALAFSAAHGQQFYIYNGTQVPLTVVPDKVAVRAAAATADASQVQRTMAAAAAVSTTEAKTLGLPGWSVVNVAASQNNTIRAQATAAAADASAASLSAVQAMAASASVAYAAPVFTVAGQETIPSGEILVGLTPGTSIQVLLFTLRNPAITGSTLVAGNTYKLTTNLKNGSDVVALANSLNGRAGIAFAEPNFIQTAVSNAIPTDPLFSQAWGLRNVGQSGGLNGFDMAATNAWDTTMGSSSVVVVVFECGIDPSHPDINATTGRDFTNAPVTGAGPRPTGNEGADNHGTWVAGCIAGRANNGLGATGVAPGVRIASARIGIPVGGGSFSASSDWIVAALDWARSIGARVTNHSYGMGAPSSAIDAALLRARDAGIVNVAAAGNSNQASVGFPASSPYCLAVGATNRSGGRASFSNYGTGLDFMAPGQDIITTDRVGTMGVSGDYATVSGTSFASPYAAGVAALVISRNPTWTAAQVEQRMKETCTDMGSAGFDSTYGWGHLNAARALTGGTGPVIPQPPPDDHGDTIATATSVAIPSTTNGAVQRAGDLDVFRFVTTSTLEITATTTGSTDTFGDLLNSSGSLITSNDDANGSLNFRIVSTLNAGTYFIRVRHYSSSSTSGSYQLVLSSRVPAAPEIRLRGNSIEIANGDTTPSTSDHTSFGQVTAAGGVIDRVFTIDNLGTADLRLTGAPAVVISGTGASQFSVLTQPVTTIAAARSATFTVRFRPTGSGVFNATLSLANNDANENPTTFAITGTGPVPVIRDDHGNTLATATLASIPGNIAGNLEQRGDVDYFRFTLSLPATVTLRSSGSTDTYGYLYNSSGSLITSNDDGAGYPNFLIRRVLLPGTYYVKVAGFGNAVTGAYTLSLSR
ncbi:MAG: DVUA0089 family protein [Verrucomicrobiaceae bacterium]|nr:DVUA0089 family protein [Verrucomicrobiaceae bacterium]